MDNTHDISALLERMAALEGTVRKLADQINHDHVDLEMLREVAIHDHEDLELLKEEKSSFRTPPPTFSRPVGL